MFDFVGYLIAPKKLNIAYSSFNLRINCPFEHQSRNDKLQQMVFQISTALPVINSYAFTSMSLIILSGYFMERSAIYKKIEVVLAFPKLSFLKRGKDIRLMFTPGLHKTLSKVNLPIIQGIVKLSGSFNLGGNFFF